MRKLVTVLSLLAITATQAMALPPLPDLHEMQSGSSVVKVKQWGVEKSHGWETEDGYTVIRDGSSGRWFYAVKNASGELVRSSYEVGGVKPGVQPHLRPDKIALASQTALAPRALMGVRNVETPSGEAKAPPLKANLPVLLVNFSDTNPTFQASEIETKYFGIGNKSFRDFYEEVSYGKHIVSAGPAGVVGWINASGTHDHYGDVSGTDHSLAGELTYEAVQKANATVDFSSYDNDGDCYVDTVVIVHQGAGQEASANTSDIWSHSFDLYSAQQTGYGGRGVFTTKDTCIANPKVKVKVNHYVIIPETLYGKLHSIGALSHEYGHVLGLPDLYDTTYKSSGIGKWSLMAAGTWLGTSQAGDTPSHLDAWSKYYLGWVTPTRLTGLQQYHTIEKVETNADVVQLLPGTATSGEYFLVENRQRSGFDAALPGTGLLVWHVDTAKEDNSEVCYPGGSLPCTTTRHYKVALEQADGLYGLEKSTNASGDANDPYASVNGSNPSFTASSTPSSALYNGSASGVKITSISASGATMTATFDDGSSTQSCSYAVSLDKTSFGVSGGTATLKVSGATSGCSWTLPSLPSWIKSSKPGPFQGVNDSLTLTISANETTSSRSQTLSFAGKTYTIVQDGIKLPAVPVIDMASTPLTTTSSTITAGGAVTADCTVKVYRNSVLVGNAKLTAISSTVSRWSIAVPSLAPGSNSIMAVATNAEKKSTSVSDTVVYSATYTITATASAGGVISPSGAVGVKGGSSMKFTLTPNAGYEIQKVTIDGKTAPSTSTVTFQYVRENHTLAVTFAPVFTVDLSATPATTTTSTITAAGKVAGDATVSVYLNGAYVGAGVVKVVSGVKTWSLPVTLPAGESVIKALAIAADGRRAVAVKTVVNQSKYTIAATASAGGTLSQGASVMVQPGATHVLTIKPNSGYRIDRILIDSRLVPSTPSVEFRNVTSSHKVEVFFAKLR